MGVVVFTVRPAYFPKKSLTDVTQAEIRFTDEVIY